MRKSCKCLQSGIYAYYNVGMSSIIDRFPLTKEVFEDKVLGCGAKKNQVLIIFQRTYEEMNQWCLQEYGAPFDVVYELIKQLTFAEWKECLKELGVKGNPTAMAYMCSKLDEEDNSGFASISFNVNLKKESSDENV